MSSIGTLHTYPGLSKAVLPKVTAAYVGFELDIPTNYVHRETNRKPEFLTKFPHGAVPALEAKDGFHLFEGTAIARYLAALAPNSGLLGSNVKETALIDQWLHFAEHEVDSHTHTVISLVRGWLTPYNKPIHTSIAERQVHSFETLNKVLATRTYLVGERITLADLAMGHVISRAATATFDESLRAKCPHVVRHMETIIHHPKLKHVFGEIKYVEKPLQYVPPPKEKKEPKAAPVQAPKADKPKPKPKPEPVVDDDDDDEPLTREEPKAKNPLDSLPKSSFNLEDWKRAYSNKETKGPGGALEWFYEHFDKEGYSIWRVDFKYNSELTQTFMSSNQIGGFFNRLEASRKYLFGSVGVLGTANKSIIAGVFILRGPEIKPVIEVAPDYESYTYTRVDLGHPGQKKFFEDALAWDLEVDGKKWVDGKNFK